MRQKTIYVRVPADLHQTVVDYCEQRNTHITDFVERALCFYLEEKFHYVRPEELTLP